MKDKKKTTPIESEPRRVIEIKEPIQTHIVQIPLDQLIPHPDNPRGEITAESVGELAASIMVNGVEQALKVVPIRKPGRKWDIVAYRIVFGHRRRKACEVVGFPTAPCVIEEMDEAKQRQAMLVENVQRSDLTPLQEGQGYKQMLKDGHNQNDIARIIGVAPGRVGNRLSILKLPAAVHALFNNNNMPTTAIPYLLKIENPDRQERLAQMIADWRLTVPKLKDMVRRKETLGADNKDKALNSAKAVEDKAQKPTKGITGWPRDVRADALTAISEMNGAAAQWADVGKAMEATCDACELTNRPVACQRCPLPAMIGSLIERSGHE